MASPWTVDGATYTYRKPLPFLSSSVGLSGDLTNQTNKVHLDNTESDFWDFSPPVGGGGVRFGDAAGTTIYDFEVESYNTTTDDGIWHVEIPTLTSATDTTIYIYYNVDVETDGSNQNNTYDANYLRVYHCNEDAAGGAFDDSTSNDDLTNNGTTSVATGIGKGRTANGSSQNMYLTTGDLAADFHGAAFLTFEATITINSLDAAAQIFANAEISAGNQAMITAFIVGTTDVLRFGGRSQSADSFLAKSTVETWAIDTEYHVVGQLDLTNDKIYIYRDGVVLINGEAAAFGSATFVDSNNQANTDKFFSGTTSGNWSDMGMDEITYSNVLRSVDWVIARNESRKGDWLTPGIKEPTAVTVTSDALVIAGTMPAPSISSTIVIEGESLITNSAMPAPFVQVVQIEGEALAVTTTMPAPTVDAPSIITGGVFSVDVSMPDPSILADTRLIAWNNMPSGKTVSFKITDVQDSILQDWTTVGMNESVIDVTAGKSQYWALSNLVTGTAQTKIHWKTNDAIPITDSEIISIEASQIAAIQKSLDDRLDATITSRASQVDLDRLLALCFENHVEADIIRDVDGKKLSSTIYLYDSAANAMNHDEVTGLIGKVDNTGTYDAITGLLTLFKGIKG